MITVRATTDGDQSSTRWLHSAHRFSFGSCWGLHDPSHGNVLVLLNDGVGAEVLVFDVAHR
ncbi:hypothetical protein ASE52_17215 [Acidovorax sp. Root275]|uniref:hypothetical protein n=1 Tax=Acidovorax sp. Root275 TaxID=1736508 RepID=UPI00070FBD0A|nr:hypothetical protein [Acidovorax sp. Root275]KRD46404.1 hypothetical protein ASE52_17215 [Acidovorax sp. Root275]